MEEEEENKQIIDCRTNFPNKYTKILNCMQADTKRIESISHSVPSPTATKVFMEVKVRIIFFPMKKWHMVVIYISFV